MNDIREKIEAAMRRRMLNGLPWVYCELAGIAKREGGSERDADRYMQKWRRKGWATFVRRGNLVLWSVTETGRTQNAPLFGEESRA